MDWTAVGLRIRKQREFMNYTREQFAEFLQVTPKFCSDIELGAKGMSIATLCKIAQILHISTDFILFGTTEKSDTSAVEHLLQQCSQEELMYAEQMLKTLLSAMNHK